MKALVFSDLHLGHADLNYPLEVPPGVEVAILAGDILAPVSSSLKWIFDHVVSLGIQVIFVAGNHEHYGFVIQQSMGDGRRVRDQYPGLHWLENEAMVINGVRFVGATMWTDYDLYQHQRLSMKTASLAMTDHHLIFTIDEEGRRGRFLPEDALEIHAASREWLEQELSKPFDGPTVVVTHHTPHPRSIHRRFSGDSLNPAFTSDLSAIIERYHPKLWIHGHTHDSFDYRVGNTRVVCNPRGYAKRMLRGFDVENEAFEPLKVIEL